MSDYLEILTILIYLLPNLIHPHVESSSNTLHSYYLKHSLQTLRKKLPYHIFCLHVAKIQLYLESADETHIIYIDKRKNATLATPFRLFN